MIITSVGQDVEQLEPSYTVSANDTVTLVHTLWKIVWQFLINLNIDLTYNPAISFLGDYPEEMKKYV